MWAGKAVTVEVTNVDEDGTVELSALQPASGVAFTATLTDLDNTDTNLETAINGLADLTGGASWQWSRSMRTSGGWTDIDKATGSAVHTRSGWQRLWLLPAGDGQVQGQTES